MKAVQDFDKSFCGTIPLNRINHIQDYGCILVTDNDYAIVQVSENVHQFTGISHDAMVERNLVELLTGDVVARLNAMRAVRANAKFSISINRFDGRTVNLLAVVSVKEDHLIFELEESRQPVQLFTDAYQRVRNSLSSIEHANSRDEILDAAAHELKRLSGFDKVMVYRFDEHWNGHVVAEAMEEGMDSYMGLCFPASDVPRQAREMYEKNHYRQIPDRAYEPVQLYPLINPLTGAFIDLSTCNLRGVAKVHVEYLGNMNVQSSMSTRILKDNRLWGLISCHHRSRHFINFDECLVFELVSNIISSRLGAVEVKEEVDDRQRMQSLQTQIVEHLYSERSLRRGIVKAFDELMQLFRCTGVAYVQQNNVYCGGDCPAPQELEDLLNWLQARDIQQPMITDRLYDELEDAKLIAGKASGVIVLPVITEHREFVLCFREEVVRSVEWGGDPNEAVRFEADNVTYHPRNSFKAWKQTVQYSSQPFSPAIKSVAKDLHSVLLNYRLREISQQF